MPKDDKADTHDDDIDPKDVEALEDDDKSEQADDDDKKKSDDKDFDYEKSYKEIQPILTKTTQANKDLQEKFTKQQEEIELLKKGAKQTPEDDKPDEPESLDDHEKKLLATIKRYKDEEYDTTGLDASLAVVRKQMVSDRREKATQRNMTDFDEFVGNEKYAKEIEGGLIPMSELQAIKAEGAKNGRDFDWETCREKYIARNQAPYLKSLAKFKKQAKAASAVDADGADPSEPTGKTESDKVREKIWGF